MAISNFKKIEDTKGYLVEDKDRKIFEREISKGYFGINIGDTIEFILYDSSNNPLPQESAKGKTVRYIEYNDNTSKEYFGKTQINKENIKSNGAEEFFIDTEKLIKEAGYSNGVFKSQVSLLNRRLGSDGRENDTTWIHEISPSRTEIRILPTIDENGKPNSDLDERYKCLVGGKTFAADVLPLMDEFVEQFDVQKALENMLTLKGTVESGQSYIKLIQEEFKIQNFEIYLQQVKDKFVQAVNHYKNNRDYNILSNRYGQPLQTTPQLCFGSNEIMDTVTTIAGNCIEYYLPKRNIQEETSLTIEQQETLDKVGEILKTVTSNTQYKSTIPPSVEAEIVGCMDRTAKNYNPNATVNVPDLCFYEPKEDTFIDEVVTDPPPPPPPKPKVCNDPAALNYGLPGVCIFPLPKDDRPIEVFPTLEYDTPPIIERDVILPIANLLPEENFLQSIERGLNTIVTPIIKPTPPPIQRPVILVDDFRDPIGDTIVNGNLTLSNNNYNPVTVVTAKPVQNSRTSTGGGGGSRNEFLNNNRDGNRVIGERITLREL